VERPFHFFGPSHVAALAVTALLSAALASLVRRDPHGARARNLERALAALLLAALAVYIPLELATGSATVWNFLPLHLCDMTIFVAIYALFTRHRLASEVLYFWAFAGATLAILTPDLATDIPGRDYFFYFGLHAGVIAAAASLTLGAGLRPRRGAPVRVWLVTNAYAAVVALIDVASGQNYMYLAAPPEQPSLLDWFGPWPVYILVCEAFALALFALLYVPVRQRAGNRNSNGSTNTSP
jgi:hypothetical integral membrane protein (TIGR02206 family)